MNGLECKRIRLHENGNVTITGHKTKIQNYSIESADSDRDDKIEAKVRAGKTEKSFYINNRHYRRIASSAVNLWEKKRNRIIFVTLTFPDRIDERSANVCFSKYVENLKTNYSLNNYIAVKELTKSGRPHFHCLFDLPFCDVRRLNSAWIHTFQEFMPGSPNALRLGSPEHGTVVKNLPRCIRYLCKYISKIRGSKYKARCIFINNSIISAPIDIDEFDFYDLIEEYSYKRYKYDYCTIVILHGTEKKHSVISKFFTTAIQQNLSFLPNPP